MGLVDVGDGPLAHALPDRRGTAGQAVDEVFGFRIAVGLPGSVESNAPTSASNGAVWEPRLSEGRAIELEASSEVVRTRSIVLAGLAVVGVVGALTVGAIVPMRRARRRRALAPRGRHGVSGSA